MATYNVRIFGYAQLGRAPVDPGPQGGTDSVFMLYPPYLWTQVLIVTQSGTAVTSTVVGTPANHNSDTTKILRIEVPDGQTIAYEVNGGNRNTAATVDSPRLNGRDQIMFGAGNTLSVIDVPSPGT